MIRAMLALKSRLAGLEATETHLIQKLPHSQFELRALCKQTEFMANLVRNLTRLWFTGLSNDQIEYCFRNFLEQEQLMLNSLPPSDVHAMLNGYEILHTKLETDNTPSKN